MMKYIIFLIFIYLFIFKIKLLKLFYQMILFFFVMNLMLEFPFSNMNFWFKLYNFLGVDYISLGLILLSSWIISMMMMVSLKIKLNYILIMNSILLFLILCFSMINIMLFYIFFESSLIPVFILILGWGYQVDRIHAGFYLMLYTLFGSMPLFLMIIMIFISEMTMMMNMISLMINSMYIYLFMMLAFLIKMPMYMVHLWLPKAHVEAPLTGSMILAGVMLKLGSYGMMRFMLFTKNLFNMNKYLIIFSLIGGIYSSFICLYQVDMKILVAYSSIVHMSLLMSGMLTLSNWGIIGGVLMMISHGLCSSGLFLLVNVTYERFESRSLFINKGLINLFPSLSLLWFFLCSSNMSFPPSLNLLSEIMLINSLLIWSKYMIWLLILIMFFSALYNLYMYSYSQYGQLSSLISGAKMINIMEYMSLLMHWMPLNLLFLIVYMY